MLHVHRAERADGLVEALRALLAEPPDDPFAPEVVAVPTRGMERWLAQRLSDRLGVCANVEFPPPRRLVADAVATASGIDADTDPWRPERAVWPLLEVVEDCLHEPWLATLAAHLGARDDDGTRRARRFATLRRLAELFDRYALHRPAMVRAWAAGRDDDGAGGVLDPDRRWQAELWRCLRERIGTPDVAERLDAACARLREDPEVVGLPGRLSLFGLTRLPAGELHVLRAIADRRDVHLFLLHPSPRLWSAIAGHVRDRPAVVRRADDPTRDVPANRLLASWGQDSREMQLVLGGAADADHHHAVEHPGGTLLALLQAGVREDREPPGRPLRAHDDDERPVLAADDRSVEIHACHGRARQVEVLRDAILHLLEDDPTLEPRDVIVMCPDIEAFAPLIHATFGAGQASGGDGDEDDALPDDVRPPDLRVRLADRALRQTNPLLGVVARLVELASERVTASQALDFVDREPVRRRFGFDDDDLGRIEGWVADSGIRWGLDAAHRAPFRLQRLDAGTFAKGLDRVLVGVAMTEDGHRLYEGVLPLDDVDSGAIDLAGRFAELVERLREAVGALGRAQTIEAWADAIAGAVDALTATAPRDAWQRAELDRILDDVVAEARTAGETAPAALELAEVRALLADRLQGRPTRANFRTGHLTICTLMPMRSVPHRVVCLLGMDDGVFPRRSPRDGDDLMLADPHAGDRDPRTEDRQLLLDALLAARDRLVVTFTGNDERTNTPRPPAVPIGELLDAIDRTARAPDGGSAAAHVLTRHPLQPFDPANFTAGALVGDAPWSFDRVTLDGAVALTGPRAAPPPFLDEPLAPEEATHLELDDLVRFVQHPVRTFLRRRLGVSLADRSDELDDALPVALDPLERWEVGDRLLEARLDGRDPRSAYRAEIARGTLPPGLLAKHVIDDVLPVVETIVAVAQDTAGEAAASSADVRVTLGDGRVLHGTVAGVAADVLRTVVYSRVGPRHRLAAWVRLLALTAARPEVAYRAVTVGRVRAGGPGRATVTVAQIPPLAGDAGTRRRVALDHLGTLVDLFDRGMREPPPLYCKTSAAYADAARRGGNAIRAASGEWESGFNRTGEDGEPEHLLVHGGRPAFVDLRLRAPRDDESGPGWDPGEPSRVGRWAVRLWDGLLAVEELSDR